MNVHSLPNRIEGRRVSHSQTITPDTSFQEALPRLLFSVPAKSFQIVTVVPSNFVRVNPLNVSL